MWLLQIAVTLLDCISDEDLRDKLLPASFAVELGFCENLATDDKQQEKSLQSTAVSGVLRTLRMTTLRLLENTTFQTTIATLFQSSRPCQALLPDTAKGAHDTALQRLRAGSKELVPQPQTSPPPLLSAYAVRRNLQLGTMRTAPTDDAAPNTPLSPLAKKAKKGAQHPQDPQEQHFDKTLRSLNSQLKQLDGAQDALLDAHDTQSLLDHLSHLIQTKLAQPPDSIITNNTSLLARHCSNPNLQQCITALSVSQELLQDSHKQVTSCFKTADCILRQAQALQTPSSPSQSTGQIHAQLAGLRQRSSDAQQALQTQAHVLFQGLTRCRRALQTLKEEPSAGLASQVPEDPSTAPAPQPGAAPRSLREQDKMKSRVAANNEHAAQPELELDVSLQGVLNTFHHLRVQQASDPKVLIPGTRRAGHYLTVGDSLAVKSGKNTVEVRTGDEVHLEHFSRGCGQHHSTYTFLCLGCP